MLTAQLEVVGHRQRPNRPVFYRTKIHPRGGTRPDLVCLSVCGTTKRSTWDNQKMKEKKKLTSQYNVAVLRPQTLKHKMELFMHNSSNFAALCCGRGRDTRLWYVVVLASGAVSHHARGQKWSARPCAGTTRAPSPSWPLPPSSRPGAPGLSYTTGNGTWPRATGSGSGRRHSNPSAAANSEKHTAKTAVAPGRRGGGDGSWAVAALL